MPFCPICGRKRNTEEAREHCLVNHRRFSENQKKKRGRPEVVIIDLTDFIATLKKGNGAE